MTNEHLSPETKVKLSLRVRPNSEAAAWVADEIISMEGHIAELERELLIARNRVRNLLDSDDALGEAHRLLADAGVAPGHIVDRVRALVARRAPEPRESDTLKALRGLYNELRGRFASEDDMSYDLRRVMIPARDVLAKAAPETVERWDCKCGNPDCAYCGPRLDALETGER